MEGRGVRQIGRYSRSRCQLAAVLVALLAPLGCQSSPPQGIEEVLALLKERADALLDPERRDPFLALLDQAERVVEEAREANLRATERLVELDRQHGASREAFERLFEESRKNEYAALDRFARLRMEARKLVTDEEWRQLSRGLAVSADAGTEDA